MPHSETCRPSNQSPGDVADQLAQTVCANLMHGLECIALALSEPAFHAREWADGAGDPDKVIGALQVALLELEGMVICRRERALMRRLTEEVMAIAHPTETRHAGRNDAPGDLKTDCPGGTAP